MYGLGTLINAAAIVVGGILGALFGKLLKQQHQDALTKVCGISVLIIVVVMTCSMGKSCAFSAIPVAILQGGVTALSFLIKPLMTEAALGNLSMVGNILIFCVGVNLVWGKKVRVANMLPSIVFAVAAAFIV